MPLIAAGAGALIGGIGGFLKKGPNLQLSGYGQEAQGTAQGALAAYRNLVGAGPGASDVTAATDASRNFANTLNNVSSSGMYDMAAGNRLAEQAFAGQRTALQQTFQDQLAQANRAASMAGRGSNDPILRARLAQEQSRQAAVMNAQQSAAAVDFGRQSVQDMLSLQGQRVNTLQGLSQQAFGNQQNLFGMGQQAYQGEVNRMFQTAGYEQSRGGGLLGGLTGMMIGAGAGLKMAQGFGGMDGGAGGGLNVTDMGFGGSLDSPVAAPAVQNLAPAAVSAAPTPLSGYNPFVSLPHMAGPVGVMAPQSQAFMSTALRAGGNGRGW